MNGADSRGRDPGEVFGGGGNVGIGNGLSSIGVDEVAAGTGKGGCSLVVKNLPFSYTWQDLKRSFREFGDVRFADIAFDAQGKSRGHGTILFANAEDAARAIGTYSRCDWEVLLPNPITMMDTFGLEPGL
ncbi:unnamed protein product [Protopolystoma xenopodis]|uniref:RRM domain-containing protein n=1 Tax=Protopolystoma xenopodis TaxID=117903 RepID=A0A3S5AJC0_9PLAT|nr:unnamed protein product [Protopolystoma xenopodis]